MNTLILIIINILGTFFGWLLTENYNTRIARIKLLNRKPFSCRPCMTFHIIAISQIIVATSIGSILYGIIGIGCAFFIFFCLWYQDKKHIQE